MIIWDVDDVLNVLTREWLSFFRETHAVSTQYEELVENPPNKILNVSRDDYLNSLDRFRVQSMSGLPPNPAVFDWFKKNGDSYRHMALSAVPSRLAHISAEWTLRHYQRWIRGFLFVPSGRADDDFERHELRKADMLANLSRADIFIDDNEDNVADADKLGLRALLFPAPWNRCRECSVESFLNGVKS